MLQTLACLASVYPLMSECCRYLRKSQQPPDQQELEGIIDEPSPRALMSGIIESRRFDTQIFISLSVCVATLRLQKPTINSVAGNFPLHLH